MPSGARGTVSAIAAVPSGATASAPRSPIGTSFAPGFASTEASGSLEAGRVAAQTPTPIATAAATAAAAASGAVHEPALRQRDDVRALGLRVGQDPLLQLRRRGRADGAVGEAGGRLPQARELLAAGLARGEVLLERALLVGV